MVFLQRHCRLKHSGDIRVVSNKNGQEKLEIEEHTDDPDHVDVPQEGTFKCASCPYSSDNHVDFKNHLPGHSPGTNSVMKCHFCYFFVDRKEDLPEHLRLHGVPDPDDFLNKMLSNPNNSECGDLSKRFKCLICPYVTNSKSQYTYHKQFHKPRGGQYICTHCTYNVSKRHLLHQHLKVHGINVTPQRQQGDLIDFDEISDEIEEITGTSNQYEHFPDIPLVWVSKSGKFSKMFKCRFCPHVNLRKVNIQEHEKMHSLREKNPKSDVEHRCTECNYVCNNAGVLSSHSKVHQGLYGTVHCLVDQVKSDEEQIRELSKFINPSMETINLDEEDDDLIEQAGEEETLYFCQDCPARFLKQTEYSIHIKLHGVRLFYKCQYCSYSARQKPHLLAHEKVHTSTYQERTRILQSMYPTATPPPELNPIKGSQGQMWSANTQELENYINKPKSVVVPLSGTELFQQRAEAQQQLQLREEREASPKLPDPQFGTLMHGNPKFIYPTYIKNGKMKEKRYKCHKCPSAFEKREQYKVHLNLHGAKQRHNCEHCDYSVKYYANYVQHLKKHKMNSEALAARKTDEDEEEEEEEAVMEIDLEVKPIENEVMQTTQILQQRLLNDIETRVDEKKTTFSCTSCPYVNQRKDALDNHLRRHIGVSGITNSYTCEHCDYSAPQVHFIKEHTKIHFTSKRSAPDGFMVCEELKLVSTNDANDEVVFQEEPGQFLPLLSKEVREKFNNNDGEKMFVNLGTGEIVETSDDES